MVAAVVAVGGGGVALLPAGENPGVQPPGKVVPLGVRVWMVAQWIVPLGCSWISFSPTGVTMGPMPRKGVYGRGQ